MEPTEPLNPTESTVQSVTTSESVERLRLRPKTVYTPSSPPQAAPGVRVKSPTPPSPPPSQPMKPPAAPPPKPPSTPAGETVQAAARTAKITLVIDPASFTSLDSIGKKVMPLEVTVAGQFRLTGTINSKSYRKILTQIEELGVENCNLILQGNMSQNGQLESLGMVVQERKVKATEAETPLSPLADGQRCA